MLQGYMAPHVPVYLFPGGMTYNSTIILIFWKSSKLGAFDLNITELSAYVRKQTYG